MDGGDDEPASGLFDDLSDSDSDFSSLGADWADDATGASASATTYSAATDAMFTSATAEEEAREALFEDGEEWEEWPDYTMQEARRLRELTVSDDGSAALWPGSAKFEATEENPYFKRARMARGVSGRIFTPEGGKVLQVMEEEQALVDELSAGQRLGPGVSYCIFCYHGTKMLHFTNTALLALFVTEQGRILPKRFTSCCSKHQRKLKRTIKRARHMNVMPYTARLHPKLRFTSMKPSPLSVGDDADSAASREERFLDSALDELQSMQRGGGGAGAR